MKVMWKDNVVGLGVGFGDTRNVGISNLEDCVSRAQEGLRLVALGEDKTVDGWLIYGEALNEGRGLFSQGGQGDKDFGAWKVASQLATPTRDDAAAAMWAAGNPKEYRETRKVHPAVRTVRGIHAKWKIKINKPAPKPPMDGDDKRKIKKLHNLVSNEATDSNIREAAKRKLDGYKSAHGEVVVENYIDAVVEWEADEEDRPYVDVEKMAEEMVEIIFNAKFDLKWRKAQVQDWLEKAFDDNEEALVGEYNFIMESKNDH